MRGSRNFRQVGGGGGSRSRLAYKKSSDVFFFQFFSPQFILPKSSDCFQRKLLFAKVPVGCNIFQGGGGSNFLQGDPIVFPL